MHATLLTALSLLAATQAAHAQEPAPPRVAFSIGAVNSYHFSAASSPLANYYALGSKVQVVLHDTWVIGFTQLTSLAPANLLAAPGLSPGKTTLAEYALSGGTKWRFSPRAYTLGSLQAGFGSLRQRDGAAPEWAAGDRASFTTAAAEASVGYHLGRFLALEAGGGYHCYFNGDKLPIATKELNNFSTSLSLVGTLGLTK